MATEQETFDFADTSETYNSDQRCSTDSEECYELQNDSSSDAKQKDCTDIKLH